MCGILPQLSRHHCPTTHTFNTPALYLAEHAQNCTAVHARTAPNTFISSLILHVFCWIGHGHRLGTASTHFGLVCTRYPTTATRGDDALYCLPPHRRHTPFYHPHLHLYHATFFVHTLCRTPRAFNGHATHAACSDLTVLFTFPSSVTTLIYATFTYLHPLLSSCYSTIFLCLCLGISLLRPSVHTYHLPSLPALPAYTKPHRLSHYTLPSSYTPFTTLPLFPITSL